MKKLLRRKRSRVLYLDHVERDCRLLFAQIVRIDLEGISKRRARRKVREKPSRYWVKMAEPTVEKFLG